MENEPNLPPLSKGEETGEGSVPKKGGMKKVVVGIVVIIVAIVLVLLFLGGGSVQGKTLAELVELDKGVECTLEDSNRPDVPHTVELEGFNIKTTQTIVDEFGISHEQVAVINETGFYTEIIPGSNLLDPQTGEECEWLKLSFPETPGENQVIVDNVIQTLDNVPADRWMCEEKNISGGTFEVSGKTCDFSLVQ